MAILYSLTWCEKKNIYLYSTLSKNSEPHSNDEKKKIRQTQTGQHYTGYLASTPQDYQSKEKQRKTKRLSQTREDQGNVTTKWNAVLWTGSWKRKETLMEKLTKFKQSQEIDINVHERHAHWNCKTLMKQNLNERNSMFMN